MSLTKEIEIGKIEVMNKWSVHVRTDTIIKDNGVEVSRSFHRHVLQPFSSVYALREDNGVMVPDLDENGDLQWTHTIHRYLNRRCTSSSYLQCNVDKRCKK